MRGEAVAVHEETRRVSREQRYEMEKMKWEREHSGTHATAI